MLTISKPLSAGQAATYHAKEFANAKENYYSRGTEIAGHWHGLLAQRFGLSGAVGLDQFQRLADGQHPITGQQLIRRAATHTFVNAQGKSVVSMAHRAGWDATFSAPKSVSLAALVGGDDRVRQAHRESVTAALRELEAFTQARLGGVRLPETTGQFVAATFEHDSARPVDGYSAPQLHTHAVVFNLTTSSLDKFRSVQPRELYKSQAFATAVYRSELARRLAGLGYDVDRGASGQPEISGFTKAYLDAASPRRKQIEDLLAAHGRTGAAAAQMAAHRTRGKKHVLEKDEVQRQHQQMAKAHGDQPHRAVQAALARSHRLAAERVGLPEPEQSTWNRAARDAVTYARDRNMERAAVVDERAVLTDALKRGLGLTTVAAVRTEFDHRVDRGELLARAPAPGAAARSWTTPEMVALEEATIARMRAGREQHAPVAPPAIRTAIDRENQHLNADQRAAVQQILSGRDQVVALEGIAGSGKTTTLKAIREAAERAGFVVHGVAPTSRATQVLAEAGMPTQTLQRYVARGEVPGHPPQLTVLDESSLASTVLMKSFLDRMGPQDRVLLVGDVRQHQSVDAGKSYEQLQEWGLSVARLGTIVRQPDPQLKAVVERLAAGDVRTAIGELDRMGKVHAISDRTERLQALTAAVIANPWTLVVCPDNESRREINDVIRTALQAARTVEADHQPTRVLVSRQEMTGTDRAYADRYAAGDIVRYNRGSKTYGLEPGEYATVVATDRDTNALTVQRASGTLVSYDPRRLQGVTVYQEQERALAVGDRVQFTAPGRKLGVANRQLGTLLELKDGNARIETDDGRSIAFRVAEHPHLDLGYAVTSHSSQGLTADRVIVHIDGDRAGEAIVNQRLAYVALSRGRHDAQIYTDNAARLAHSLSREVSHRAAIEETRRQQQVL